MDDKRYKGWPNYATWRVNLEIVEDLYNSWSEDGSSVLDLSAYELACVIRDAVTDLVTQGPEATLAETYALAFLADVDWHYIAKSCIENHKDQVTNA